MTIVAAADGSALGNPGPAGWAWYVDDSTWAAGGWPHGTNNQGELMAVIDLLDSTAHIDDDLRIICDSQYVINAVTKWMPGWKRKGWRKADGSPVLNRELLERLDRAVQGRRYTFEWVKGHAGHELNEAADVRARAVALAYQKGDPIPIGPGWPGRTRADESTGELLEPEREAELEAELETELEAELETELETELELELFGEDFGNGFDGSPADDHAVVRRLENELLEPAVRSDPSRLAALLHPAFEEIGSSGRLWSRDAVVESLGDEDPSPVLEVLSTDTVGDGVVLLTSRTSDARGASLRSSLWLRVDGRWRLRFHQGTPEAE